MKMCSADRQLTISTASIALGAVAGFLLSPSKFIGIVGGMIGGGVVGAVALSMVCDKQD